ncbi:MAG: hypothetical protein QF880_03935 [Candidatus Poseidonia sp.]|nr:hypothetical protein [Poseidonia sp.]
MVKLSVLEYEDRLIPIPLFAASIGLMTGFTFIFPLLGVLTLPTAMLTVYSILTGDITFVDDASSIQHEMKLLEEE